VTAPARAKTSPVSYLFVPATRPDRVDKARRSEADEVIVDLEDAVAAHDKAAARGALADLPDGRRVHVRINALGSPHYEADLNAVAGLPSVSAVVVPKVEHPDDVAAVASALPPGIGVIALVESARGVVAADDIARGPVSRLIFGSADYLTDIGAAPSARVLAYPRSRLVVASRAAGLPAPVDGPALITGAENAVRADAEEAKALGMGAKLCIHPAQVAVVNDVFGASEGERRWARGVLAEAEHRSGAFVVEGSMVDEPVLARARQLLGGD
jgi:citrate lyase subunit beta / citryl-CoA lyase